MPVSQCPKCELKFTYRSEMHWHLREDHPRAKTTAPTPATEESPPKKIIIWATDGSPTMKSECPVAKNLAESSGAKLLVAHAGEMVSADKAGIFVDSTEALEAALERTVDDLKRVGLDAELAMVKANQGNAAQLVAHLAQQSGAEMIVVGNRGMGPVAAFFLGSFTFRLLQVAPCPVVVVPTGGKVRRAVADTQKHPRRADRGRVATTGPAAGRRSPQ